MAQGFPILPGEDISQFDFVQSIHPKYGWILRAQRHVVDTHSSIYWTIVVKDQSEMWVDSGLKMDGTREAYSTSELREFARRHGFGEWRQAQVGEVQGIAWTASDQPVTLQLFQVPDPTYYPEWVTIEQLHIKGLSDTTIVKLIQEDVSFSRMRSGIVEYDINKVYGHPKVQEFASHTPSGQATAISYENILNS